VHRELTDMTAIAAGVEGVTGSNQLSRLVLSIQGSGVCAGSRVKPLLFLGVIGKGKGLERPLGKGVRK